MSRLGRAIASGLGVKSERGATAIEYGLIVALISVVIIAAITLAGENLRTIFNTIADKLSGATGG